MKEALRSVLEESLGIRLIDGELTEGEEGDRAFYRGMVLSEEHNFSISSSRRFRDRPNSTLGVVGTRIGG